MMSGLPGSGRFASGGVVLPPRIASKVLRCHVSESVHDDPRRAEQDRGRSQGSAERPDSLPAASSSP
jgi:hypothetical protein